MIIFKENKKYIRKKRDLNYKVPVIRLRIFINLCRLVISISKENKVDQKTSTKSVTDLNFMHYIFDIYHTS